MPGIRPYSGQPNKKRLIAAMRGEPTDRVPNFEILIEDQHVEKLLGRPAGNTLGVGGDPAKGSEAAEGVRPMYPEDYLELCRIIGQDAIVLENLWTPIKRRGTDGSKVLMNDPFPKRLTAEQLGGPWQVQFDPEWGPAEPVTFDSLISWTDHDDPLIKYFSGQATYRTTFDLAGGSPENARLWLDLGQPKNLAAVRLNGKNLGVVWTAPWRVEITDAVQPKGNRLEIDVVNLWPNRLIGDAGLPPEKRRTRTNVTSFRKDTPLLPSGLLGPVQLRAAGRTELQK
jgi:hypothetical protein